ncbi:ly6/PLAUR domain-containing protein 5 [Fukomys damarensis]|uniref:ly6/PLAUR domain-containing protein 5 n=1 Tax=Fukomys damarensis TaxID=885580 RepID=UPI00053FE1B5|nr:ly6/PLAUR domain-containing protein 5 [Fukomys damarensis]
MVLEAEKSKSMVLASGSRALQCYSMEHIYFGHFDLSALQLPNVSCPLGCSEVVMSLDTARREPWCSAQPALPCSEQLAESACIHSLAAPSPQTLSGTECYVCLGVHPEDCSVEKSRRVQCHRDQSVCYQGNGRMNTGNFSVPVYIRTCHRPSCIVVGTSSPWTAIDLNGSCCEGSLCNGGSLNFTAVQATAPPRAPRALALLLTSALLASALGGPLGLSA